MAAIFPLCPGQLDAGQGNPPQQQWKGPLLVSPWSGLEGDVEPISLSATDLCCCLKYSLRGHPAQRDGGRCWRFSGFQPAPASALAPAPADGGYAPVALGMWYPPPAAGPGPPGSDVEFC